MGGKYRQYQSYRERQRATRRKVHPIWRGIGCILLVIMPITAYAASVVLLEQNRERNWFPIPVDLLIGPGNFFYSLIPDSQLVLKALLTILFTMVFFAVFNFVSFIITSAAGGTERSDPYYVPPARSRRRRY